MGTVGAWVGFQWWDLSKITKLRKELIVMDGAQKYSYSYFMKEQYTKTFTLAAVQLHQRNIGYCLINYD